MNNDLVKWLLTNSNSLNEQSASGKRVLYHYAPDRFKEILSLREQVKRGITKVSQSELSDKDKAGLFRGYKGLSGADQVCFFFDPIPLDVIGGQYPNDHKAWSPGNKLFELQVNLEDAFDEETPFSVTETKADNFMADYLWPGDMLNGSLKRPYFMAKNIVSDLRGDSGTGIDSINKVYDRYKGKTRDSYMNLIKNLHKDDDYKYMYAPSVPHLQMWPKGGSIVVANAKLITIPSKKTL